jgi:hypothetical protein
MNALYSRMLERDVDCPYEVDADVKPESVLDYLCGPTVESPTVRKHKRRTFCIWVAESIRADVGTLRPRDRVNLEASKMMVRKKVNEVCDKYSKNVRTCDRSKIFNKVWMSLLTMSRDDLEVTSYECWVKNKNAMELAIFNDSERYSCVIASLLATIRRIQFSTGSYPEGKC